MVLGLFTLTTFTGAALLFMVQPMAAKLVLPSFGGSATVWSTSSLLFQVLLLVGYIYAHATTRRLGVRWQPAVHVVLLLVPLLVLPVALPANAAPGADASPVIWLLRVLCLMVGLPFLVLSATGPLIQRWYTWSDGPRADDPYFLFSASNLGSFVGLLAYPLILEPNLTLSQQRIGWSIGFGFFVALMAACALATRRGPAAATAGDVPAAPVAPSPAPTTRRILLWVALAFLPSTLMLSATAHLSTDVAAVPLLWVLPLAAYLASFVAAFARTSREWPRTATRIAVALATLSAVLSLSGAHLSIVLMVVIDVAMVGAVSYAAHARLAATRPAPEHLTQFYILVSLGGALGGLLNGFLAPMVFNRIWEYGLALAATPLLLVQADAVRKLLTSKWGPRLVLPAVVTLPLLLIFGLVPLIDRTQGHRLLQVVAVLLVLAGAWWASRQPITLALVLLLFTSTAGAAVVLTSALTERTFYGTYQVTHAATRHSLVHGSTIHGYQMTAPELRDEPTSYYGRGGPVGDIFETVQPAGTVAVGLGVGTLAAYSTPERQMTFVEIDPAVVRIAEDTEHFTYLADATGPVDVVTGDGRLALADMSSGTTDLVALDAFTSDAIPTHLLTVEALAEFTSLLAEDGVLAVHISNRHFDLAPVLAAAADELGLHAVSGTYADAPEAHESLAYWVVLTTDQGRAAEFEALPGWEPLTDSGARVWTDDYSSVLSVLK